jgi:hypothetical protein
MCPFPGCENALISNRAWACGHHQRAIRALAVLIDQLSSEAGFKPRQGALIGIARELTPYVFVEIYDPDNRGQNKPENKPRLRPSVSTLGLSRATGVSVRSIYRIRTDGAFRLVDGQISTREAILFIVAVKEMVNVSTAAEEIGVSHRCLRHLVHELSLDLGAVRFPYPLYNPTERFFWRSELPELKEKVARIRTCT